MISFYFILHFIILFFVFLPQDDQTLPNKTFHPKLRGFHLRSPPQPTHERQRPPFKELKNRNIGMAFSRRFTQTLLIIQHRVN